MLVLTQYTYTLWLLIAFKMAYSCCFSLEGNLDFPDFLQKKFYNLAKKSYRVFSPKKNNFPTPKNYVPLPTSANCPGCSSESFNTVKMMDTPSLSLHMLACIDKITFGGHKCGAWRIFFLNIFFLISILCFTIHMTNLTDK